MGEPDYNILEDIISELENAQAAWPFLQPVDWKSMQLDDYPLIVQDPIDLSIVRKKLEAREYKIEEEFWQDVYKIWSNCKKYNSESSKVFDLALEMETLTDALKASLVTETETNEKEEKKTHINKSNISNMKKKPKYNSVLRAKNSFEHYLNDSKLSSFVYVLSQLNARHRMAVIRYIAEHVPQCFIQKQLTEEDDANYGEESMKIDMDISYLIAKKPAVYDYSYRLMKSLLFLTRTKTEK